jgi:hypothetical protein
MHVPTILAAVSSAATEITLPLEFVILDVE